MLYDRPYMRADDGYLPWYRRLSACGWLILANVAVFTAQLAVPLMGASPGKAPPSLEVFLALYPQHLLEGRVWELLTFQFLHGGLFHLIINSAMLYMFGRTLEMALGWRRFLALYFGSGVAGGLLHVLCSLMFRGHFGLHPVVGASAGVFGLIAAFACLNPNLSITTLVAFIIPVSMRAIYLIPIQVVISLLGMLDRSSGIAHAAHLGGMLAGIGYVQFVLRRQMPTWARSFSSSRRRHPELVPTVAAPTAPTRPRVVRQSPELPPAEFISREVDPILEKISAHGIHSLTERERKILEQARDKMKQR